MGLRDQGAKGLRKQEGPKLVPTFRPGEMTGSESALNLQDAWVSGFDVELAHEQGDTSDGAVALVDDGRGTDLNFHLL